MSKFSTDKFVGASPFPGATVVKDGNFVVRGNSDEPARIVGTVRQSNGATIVENAEGCKAIFVNGELVAIEGGGWIKTSDGWTRA